jgi:cell division septum initiation protein DivIVA
MEALYYKKEIKRTFSDIRTVSFEEKKSSLMQEEQINAFLDAIIDLKSVLNQKTQVIESINERIEKITWFTDLDEDCLLLLNDLISSARDLRTTLVRQYVSLSTIRKKGIAKEEIKNFKSAMDDLKEICDDMESVFFFLPKMPLFVETTKLLSLV